LIHISIREAAERCGALALDNVAGEAADAMLSGVSTDTRRIAPGQLFVPLAGDNFDGHDYVRAAAEAGAGASLWQAAKARPRDCELPLIVVEDTLAALQALAAGHLRTLSAKVVAITGSNGKTTTKDLVSSVLATRLRVHRTEGNFNNHIGLPLTILSAPQDTEALVLEMGMSGRGEIALLASLAPPDAAVITNVGEAHLLQLGSRRNIARAKLEIAEGLKPGGVLIMNGDEPLLAEELGALALADGIELVTFGEGPSCAIAAANISLSAEGTLFTTADDPATAYELPAPGKHNAINALAAIAVGRRFGLSAGEIKDGLKAARMTGMRIERSAAYNGAVILNDAYNASPTSVKAAIDLVARLHCDGSKWIVLGDMLELGPDEAEFHREIGRYLTPDKTDFVLIYGPLSENTYNETVGKFPQDCVRYYRDKDVLAGELRRRLKPGDLVLVKASRGMKMETVVAALQIGAGE